MDREGRNQVRAAGGAWRSTLVTREAHTDIPDTEPRAPEPCAMPAGSIAEIPIERVAPESFSADGRRLGKKRNAKQ